jgi:peroxiredoxin
LKPLGFSAAAAGCGGDATKIFRAGTKQNYNGVDRSRTPAHYQCIVTFRLAPEARGILGMRAVAALCRAATFCVFCFALLPPRAEASELRPWTGSGRLPFSLPGTAGTVVALESARGRIVLVHFFATWCEPCRVELPALNRLAARANGSVKVLAIAVADADRSVQRFLENAPVDFPVLLDRDRAVARAWQVATLPTSFVIDASLRPRFVVESDYAWDTVDPGKFLNSSVTGNANARN